MLKTQVFQIIENQSITFSYYAVTYYQTQDAVPGLMASEKLDIEKVSK